MEKIKFKVHTKDWEGVTDSFDVLAVSWIPAAVSVTFTNSAGDTEKMFVEEDKLRQFIGRKDDHGVEIYKGDIVKYYKRNLNQAFGEEGEAWEEKIKLIEWFSNGWTIPKGFVKDIEVIGDIYESPTLLNDKLNEKENDK